MDALNKLPRSFLVVFGSFGLAACGILVTTARADLDRFKSIALSAESVSERNKEDISELKTTTDKILLNQDQTRREYREDQAKLADKLESLLVAVNKK